MLAPQNLDPLAATTVDHRHCIDFSLPLHHRSIQPIIFYVGKLFWGDWNMFFTFLNFYILLSLSIRFNCLWNVVSLWLWVASDLSFFVFVFMEFCWFMVVGYFGFKFFCFFFLWRFPHFLLLPLLSNLWQRRIKKFFLLDFLFPFFFCMQFLLDFWFLGILLFGVNFGFVIVDI